MTVAQCPCDGVVVHSLLTAFS